MCATVVVLLIFLETVHLAKGFLQVNPGGKVPVVKFDEKWVSDSDVIANGVGDIFGDVRALKSI
ncbi:hypothetical protein F8388_001293 [Cannabis sativa]|uniref:GST N-terminal domain-containing protein n=1 Tax=Cannabis sativa TaxID=3483 RepID=A0A7J6DVH5_CANSA|nr:hypothetical protein F8388_001293 [Cannabis sativa]